MKRIFVAALVGAVLLWMWQFASFAFPNFHYSVQQYTPLQDSILPVLERINLPQGGYVLPNVPKDDMAGAEKLAASMQGKPWAVLHYYKQHNMNMAVSSLSSFLSNLAALVLVGIVISGLAKQRFANVLVTVLCFGLVIFFGEHSVTNSWYPVLDIWVYLLDAVVGWGIVGLWMGWYYQRYPAK